jgi:hypothetical protein
MLSKSLDNSILTTNSEFSLAANSTSFKLITNLSSLSTLYDDLTSLPATVTVTSFKKSSYSILLLLASVNVKLLTTIAESEGAFNLNLATS